MTLLLNSNAISKAYGSRQLFSEISFGIFKGDKVGLVGPNGSGKSTLLKILAGIDLPDSGEITRRKNLRIGYVPQSSEYPDCSIEEYLINSLSNQNTSSHEREVHIKILLSKFGFKDLKQKTSALSGGWKKRLDLAKELLHSPDLLLLDEPTNHLDLEGIIWLEKFLKNEPITFMLTSHDRYFLQNAMTRIIELNSSFPQGIFISEGNYAHFLEKRNELIAYQQQRERVLSSKVRQELDWLRQSPKARTTKAQARVQEAGRLMDQFSELCQRNKRAKAKIDFESSERQTRKLLVIKNIAKSLGNQSLFSGIDLTFTPGMCLGIVGANGTGKSTLLKILAGEILPDKGTIKPADGLKIVYFDQHRQKLSPDITLKEALSPNSDTVFYRGSHIHVNSWAKRFLFSPERLALPVSQLSGGEKARISIAHLMLKPADLLLLDEPTNDLDIPTLETLEESLAEFTGAIALITHDRALLDRLATCVIGLGVKEMTPPLLADYDQWEQFLQQQQEKRQPKAALEAKIKTQKIKSPRSIQKLSFHEKKELEQMENAILSAEQQIATIEQKIKNLDPQQQLKAFQECCHDLDVAQKKMEALFLRWQDLENRSQQ